MRRALLVLALTACDGAEPLQLVAGRVAGSGDFPGVPAQLRGVAGDAVVATAPLDEAGSFLVGLPAGHELRLDLIDAAGKRVAWIASAAGTALQLDVCEPGARIDLGEVGFDAEGCGATAACTQRNEAWIRCLEAREPGDCEEQRCIACEREEAALERCLAAAERDDACREVRTAFDVCKRRSCPETSCDPCETELQARREACSVCSPDSPTAVVSNVAPTAMGCEVP